MRVLVDAMCAEYGGIRTYVENLLDEWPIVYPDDELHVVTTQEGTLPSRSEITYRRVPVSERLGPLGRPLAQTVHLRRAAAELRPDVILATLPSTTVLDLGAPTAVVIYDLRHRLRPEQFSRQTRLLRAVSYRRGYALADGFISISQRSLDDLHRLHPTTRDKPGVVAHLGADHVDAWPRTDERKHAVAFAHQSNKNLDLVLNGWRRVVDQNEDRPRLLIVGVGKQRRAEVTAAIAALGLSDEVELAPFLPDDEFQRVFAAARVVVFPSDFEGFGLPVAEGMRLGIPVVIGPEPATREVAAGHAVEMAAWTPEALADAVTRALEADAPWLAEGRDYAERYSWAATVEQTRALLTDITRPASPHPPRSEGTENMPRPAVILNQALIHLRVKVRSLLPDDTPKLRTVQGTPLWMPRAHRLADYAAHSPEYSQNLVRFAEALDAGRELQFIDVGANIGDSTVQILAARPGSALCVEADGYWLPFLEKNVADLNVTVAHQLLVPDGNTDTEARRPVRNNRGTTHFSAGEDTGTGAPIQISDLPAAFPAFDNVRLIKSDTDGYDVILIPALARTYAASRPALFFEFDVALSRNAGNTTPESVFTDAAALGYDTFAAWDNRGLPVAVFHAAGVDAAMARHHDDVAAGRAAYWDVAAVHDEDTAGREAIARLTQGWSTIR